VSRELANVTARGKEVKYLFVKEQESATPPLGIPTRLFGISKLDGEDRFVPLLHCRISGSQVRERTGLDLTVKVFPFAINVLRLTNLAQDLLWVPGDLPQNPPETTSTAREVPSTPLRAGSSLRLKNGPHSG
jgi:hypothetical protein